MSWLELQVARWLCNRLVSRGYPAARITVLFRVLREELSKTFREDNEPTQTAFINELVTASVKT